MSAKTRQDSSTKDETGEFPSVTQPLLSPDTGKDEEPSAERLLHSLDLMTVSEEQLRSEFQKLEHEIRVAENQKTLLFEMGVESDTEVRLKLARQIKETDETIRGLNIKQAVVQLQLDYISDAKRNLMDRDPALEQAELRKHIDRLSDYIGSSAYRLDELVSRVQKIPEDDDQAISEFLQQMVYAAMPLLEPTNTETDDFLVQRHTDVRLPQKCRLGSRAALLVGVRLSPIFLQAEGPYAPRSANVAVLNLMASAEEMDERGIEITVMVYATGFEMAQPWRVIEVPFEGEAEAVEFVLTPVMVGEQVVEVEFLHGTARVAYVVVETEVVNDDAG